MKATEKVDYAEIYHAEEGTAIGNAGASYHNGAPKVSLFASTPIQVSGEYKSLIFKERGIFLLNMVVLVIFGPLVFRYALGANQYVWAAGVNSVEWFILMVIFLDTLNSIFRGLPMVSGKPTELEATRGVSVHGTVVIGNCSPFVSEDEAIFLRALIGKTCTVFNTCAGRHSLHGLYVDTVLNEKRLKGEEHRKAMWLAWMTFINSMIQLCLKIKHREYTQEVESAQEAAETGEGAPRPSNFAVGRYDGDGGGEHNIRISKVEAFSTATADVETTNHFRNLGMLTRTASRSRVLSSSDKLNESGEKPKKNSGIFQISTSAPVTRLSVFSEHTEASSPTERGTQETKQLPQDDAYSSSAMAASTTSVDEGGGGENPLINGGGDPTSDVSKSKSQDSEEYSGYSNSSLPHSNNEEFLVDVADIVPLLSFLHHWLSVLKDREWTYDYRNTASALDSIFLAAPFLEIFDAEDIVEVHSLMVELYDVFTGTPVADPPDPKLPINGDDMIELRWVFKRSDLPDWNIHWQYYSRARLRPLEYGQFRDPPGPRAEFVTTRIKPGAIVYQTVESRAPAPGDLMDRFLETRRYPFKVTSMRGDRVTVSPFPHIFEGEEDKPSRKGLPSTPPVSVNNFRLLEQNRGKAGAMNAYADILRAKAMQWIVENDLSRPPQILLGVVDARHMLAEPSIFFNDALPYFSVDTHTRKPLKKFGEHQSDSPLCMLVQYPQYFTNVNHEDFLDNKNAAYYTLWQALRDAGKVCTSSGSNAIWEISNPSFEFATTSRIEDTGTSHKYLSKSTTVSMPCFVAYGIAKKTEDYLEAVYRWSTGAVELFWGTIWSDQIGHFIVVAVIGIILGLACFHPTAGFYWLWLVICAFVAIVAAVEQHFGHKPLRPLIVSTIVVVNCTNWMGNLLSLTWVIIIPVEICFKGRLPLSSTPERALFWMWCSLVLRLTSAFMSDVMVRILRHLNQHTAKWNFTMVLWRSSQLYACSFAYSFLSFLSGTRSAYNARFHDADLTMWASFRVSNSQMDAAWAEVMQQGGGLCSGAMVKYMKLLGQSIRSELGKPDVLTRWFAVAVFSLQFICILVSCNFVNNDDTTLIFVTMLVCGLNIFLVTDIAMLLFPVLGDIFGRPARPEYIFGFVAVIIVISSLVQGIITPGSVWRYISVS